MGEHIAVSWTGGGDRRRRRCRCGRGFLVARGDADRDRLAIAGGSAGGYTTLAALAFRDVFAAGITRYGIGDLETLARDTHKFESRYMDRLVGPYPEMAERYRERSPIHFLDRITCPVLVMQGLEDQVVPPSQAESLVAALTDTARSLAPTSHSRARGTGSAALMPSAGRSRPRSSSWVRSSGSCRRMRSSRWRCSASRPGVFVATRRGGRPRPRRCSRPSRRGRRHDGSRTRDARARRSRTPREAAHRGAPTARRGIRRGIGHPLMFSNPLELVLGLFVVAVGLGFVARRIGVAYPILLVLGGLVLGFVPGVPPITLEPDLVFLLLLPPILFGAGYSTPIRDFKANARPIALLAVGLVLFTTVVVGLVTKALVPQIPLAAAFALGAIVAPPDAVAATAIFRRLGVPRRS